MNYQEEQRKKTNIILLFTTFTLSIIAIYVISFFLKEEQSSAKIIIDNLDVLLPNMPDQNKQSLYNQLYQIVSINTKSDKPIYTNGALIDQDTFNINEGDGVVFGDFVVDLKDINQKYSVQYNYGHNHDGYSIYVSCIVEECTNIDEATFSTYQNVLSFLPYSSTVDSVHFILDKNSYFSPNNYHFSLYIDACEENATLLHYIKDNIINNLSNLNITNYQLEEFYSCSSEY